MAAAAKSAAARASGALSEPEVHIVGQILGASGVDAANVFCVWEALAGRTWECVGGDQEGQTQVDYGREGKLAVWNHPVDLHYYTQTLQGWPKLVFEVYSLDEYGGREAYGYSFCFVPMRPGFHELKCAIWKPLAGTKEEVQAFFLGGAPELLTSDPIYARAKDDRCRLFTKAAGTVQLQLEIVLRHMEAHKVESS